MAKNLVQGDEKNTWPAPYDRTSGQGALIGSMFGVASNDVLSGSSISWEFEGTWDLTKNNLEAWTVGQKIYWDNTNKNCTSTATSNTLIGCAAAVASNPSTVGRVRLNGTVV